MDIVIIGAGNVATVLGRKFFASGYRIQQVYNRHPERGRLLAMEWQADFTDQKKSIVSGADLYLMALSDNSIPAFASDFSIEQGLVVHTAGAVSIDILRTAAPACGILYPLQSLRSALPAPAIIPMLIDASNPQALGLLREICRSLEMPATEAGDADRIRYHLAAVMANNFSNHFFALAADYCAREKIDFNQLLPLLSESVHRLNFIPPRDAQTGPALRNDTSTIEKHLALLEAYPALSEMYQTITRSIIEMYR